MEIGKFVSNWKNEKNFGNRFSDWNWERAKPITDKGLLVCQDNTHFAFRMQNGVVYAQRELELPITVRQKQKDGSFREIHVIPLKGEVEKKELEEEDIRKLFEMLPDMPQKQRQSPLEDVQLASRLDEEVVYKATIKYGDPYKIDGYEEKIEGNLSAIKQKAHDLEDYMWQKMNCNGSPYINVVIGDRNYTKKMELIPPPVFTGKWLRSHAHLLAKPYLDIVACQVFLGSPSASATAEVRLDEVMCFVEDEKKYFSSSTKAQDNFLAWRSFSVVK